MTIAPERPVHVLHEMNGTGHTDVTWNPADETQVSAARERFARLRGEGYLAYKVDPGNDASGEHLREFDPTAHRIVMTRQLQGG